MNNICLGLALWNVQGLNDSIYNDRVFGDILSNNDIIVLTETWLDESNQASFPGFYAYHNVRVRNPNARRPSGGVSILIRNHIRSPRYRTKGATFVKENEYYTWMKLDKGALSYERNIYICAIYLPPRKLYLL